LERRGESEMKKRRDGDKGEREVDLDLDSGRETGRHWRRKSFGKILRKSDWKKTIKRMARALVEIKPNVNSNSIEMIIRYHLKYLIDTYLVFCLRR
jgi:hypothetical protein